METTNVPATTLPAIGPTGAGERIETIDIVRGFAIFGILLVNMGMFSTPILLAMSDTQWWTGSGDRVATWLIRFFAEGKFYPVFSFLFGLALTLQMDRVESRGLKFSPLYRRRLFILLAIGLVHAFLIWSGDILVPYALFGFLLLLFRNRKPKTLLIWAIIFLLIPVLLIGVAAAAIELGRSIPEAAKQINAAFAQAAAEGKKGVELSLQAYSSGSLADIMVQRLRDLQIIYTSIFFYGPNIFALFLLGLYAGKRRIFQDTSAHSRLLGRVRWWGLGLGVVGNLLYVITREYSNFSVPNTLSFLAALGLALGGPAFCFFYVTSLVALAEHRVGRKWLRTLAPVGRTAVSNYLFQSLLCTTIFYSYGLGLFGKVGPGLGLVLTAVVFALQLFLSGWWLRHFRFGPVEWLWRSLTYGKRQVMRLTGEVNAGG